jgi:hypothetical protein
MSGKGSKRRPTDEAAYAEGWERLWGAGRQQRGQIADSGIALPPDGVILDQRPDTGAGLELGEQGV